MSKKIKLILSLIPSLLLVILKPLQLTQHQAFIFGVMVLMIIWWVTELVSKTGASAILLAFFVVFTDVPRQTIFSFPLSKSFLLVLASFLLSQGIVNTGVAKRLSNALIVKRCKNTRQLVTMTFIIGFLLTFLIPHPFSRVIILSGIYLEMLRRQKIEGVEFMIIMFAVSVSAIAASMILINGDVVLNYAAVDFTGASITGSDWIEIMTVPGTATYVMIWLIFRVFLFKDLNAALSRKEEALGEVSRDQKISFLIMAGVVGLWFTESFHHINAAYPAMGGAALMAVFGIIRWEDRHVINYRLLIFVSAIISIGKVLLEEGIAGQMSSALLGVFPPPESPLYLLVLILSVILIHLLIGSSLATLSVIMVPLIALTEGVLSPVVIGMISYMIVNTHFILPIHNTVLLIGYGEQHFDTALVARYGAYMTVGIFVAIYGFFFPWWRLIGLM